MMCLKFATFSIQILYIIASEIYVRENRFVTYPYENQLHGLFAKNILENRDLNRMYADSGQNVLSSSTGREMISMDTLGKNIAETVEASSSNTFYSKINKCLKMYKIMVNGALLRLRLIFRNPLQVLFLPIVLPIVLAKMVKNAIKLVYSVVKYMVFKRHTNDKQ